MNTLNPFRFAVLFFLVSILSLPANAAYKEWGGICSLGGYWDDPACWESTGGATGGVPQTGDGGFVRWLMPGYVVKYRNVVGDSTKYSNFSLGSTLGGPVQFDHFQDRFASDYLTIGSGDFYLVYRLGGTAILDASDLLIAVGQAETSGAGMYLTDDALLLANNLSIGNGGSAKALLEQSGGVLRVEQSLQVGSGDAVYRMTGGTASTEWLYIGSNGRALADLSGGTLSLQKGIVGGMYGPGGAMLSLSGNANLTWHPGHGSGEINIAYLKVGDGIHGPGRIVQSGNSFVDVGDLNIGFDSSSTQGNVGGAQGYYEITGGTCQSGEIIVGHYGEGAFLQEGGLVSAYKIPCPPEEPHCVYFDWFPGHLRLGSNHSGKGLYVLKSGTLDTQWTVVGEMNEGTFRQSGGIHETERLILSGNGWPAPTPAIGDIRGSYFLTGGSLKTTETIVGREGKGWMSGEGSFIHGGRFTQTGGTHTVTDSLTLGDRAQGDYIQEGYGDISSGSYFLADGTLNTLNTVVGNHGEGLFRQTGGVHNVCNLTIAEKNLEAGSKYLLEGGTLNVGSIQNYGLFEHLGGSLAMGACEQRQFNNFGIATFIAAEPLLVTGTFVNQGTLDTRDASVKFADLRLTTDSVTKVKLGEPIKVTGTIEFGGTIEVIDPNGLAAEGGFQLFDLQEGATKSGDFTRINLPETRDDSCWDAQTLLTTGTLSARRSDGGACSSEVNYLPRVDAGPNVLILTEAWATTSIIGFAKDRDSGDILQYRWQEGSTNLSAWSQVDENNRAPLVLMSLDMLSAGDHVLTLEVTDGKTRVRDTMIITLGNSPPHAVPNGGGVYELGATVQLGGEVSDFDGDMLECKWFLGEKELRQCAQDLYGNYDGAPVMLTPCSIDEALGVGEYMLTLTVSDGVNQAIQKEQLVTVVDTGAPTLAPVANRGILWPPNHKMVPIIIETHASDNSGEVIVEAEIFSNEPESGLGDGDTAPDWDNVMIDQSMGVISLELRSERSGSGTGRVYTVTVTARDSSGNQSQSDVTFAVPHDQSKK